MCIMNLLLITILLQQMQIICRNFQLKKKDLKIIYNDNLPSGYWWDKYSSNFKITYKTVEGRWASCRARTGSTGWPWEGQSGFHIWKKWKISILVSDLFNKPPYIPLLLIFIVLLIHGLKWSDEKNIRSVC